MPFQLGYEEDKFPQQFEISLDDIEPRTDFCTKVRRNRREPMKRNPSVMEAMALFVTVVSRCRW